MSPELERLPEAIYERDHCEHDRRGRCERNVRRLTGDALQRMPNVSRDDFLEALKDRYQQGRADAFAWPITQELAV